MDRRRRRLLSDGVRANTRLEKAYKMLGQVPFFAGVRREAVGIEPLGSLTNMSYKVTVGGDAYVLRLAWARHLGVYRPGRRGAQLQGCGRRRDRGGRALLRRRSRYDGVPVYRGGRHERSVAKAGRESVGPRRAGAQAVALLRGNVPVPLRRFRDDPTLPQPSLQPATTVAGGLRRSGTRGRGGAVGVGSVARADSCRATTTRGRTTS